MGALFRVAFGLLGTVLLWALVVGLFVAFAAGMIAIASRLLPLTGRRRRRDKPSRPE
jgi:hypothetical protein